MIVKNELEVSVYQLDGENLCMVVKEEESTETSKVSILGIGWEYNLWHHVMERAGACEFAELTVNGKQITTEEYVALNREVFRNIKPFKQLLEQYKVMVSLEGDREKKLSRYYQSLVDKFDHVYVAGDKIKGEKLILEADDLKDIYQIQEDDFEIRIDLVQLEGFS